VHDDVGADLERIRIGVAVEAARVVLVVLDVEAEGELLAGGVGAPVGEDLIGALDENRQNRSRLRVEARDLKDVGGWFTDGDHRSSQFERTFKVEPLSWIRRWDRRGRRSCARTTSPVRRSSATNWDSRPSATNWGSRPSA